MIRISGVNLPENKRAVISLTYIEGIGINSANKILKKLKIDCDERLKNLTDNQIEDIRQEIEKNYTVEGNLRTQVNKNIKRLKEISCYRGVRHTKNLPVRGQRTKTNARTKRGKKVTIGSGRKKAADFK